jgi:hypothetical protein
MVKPMNIARVLEPKPLDPEVSPMPQPRFRTLDEFWPYYVGEHRQPLTRTLHFIGNTNLLVWLLLAMMRRSFRMVMLGIVTSYAFAWFGHFVIERNRPATFDYPILSALADMRMYAKMWRGEMDAEVEKYAPEERHIIV